MTTEPPANATPDWETLWHAKDRAQTRAWEVRKELLACAYQKAIWHGVAFIAIPFLGHWLMPHQSQFWGILWGINFGAIIGIARALNTFNNSALERKLAENWEEDHPA